MIVLELQGGFCTKLISLMHDLCPKLDTHQPAAHLPNQLVWEGESELGFLYLKFCPRSVEDLGILPVVCCAIAPDRLVSVTKVRGVWLRLYSARAKTLLS